MVTIVLLAAANANIGRLETGSIHGTMWSEINMEDCRWLFQEELEFARQR